MAAQAVRAVGGIVFGLLLVWLSFSLTSRDGTALWSLLVPASIVLVVSVFTLVFGNTRRARDKWQQYVLDDDDDDDDDS
ncbi:hypothetical protein [Microbacterium oleivorans]|uniref:hypothetical protein n=1 Tax=Microbacterium oleivorans TaxID=273677 RepID=UPI000564EE2D|nr:hypothetical protein [Microbacterium oleivorans]